VKIAKTRLFSLFVELDVIYNSVLSFAQDGYVRFDSPVDFQPSRGTRCFLQQRGTEVSKRLVISMEREI